MLIRKLSLQGSECTENRDCIASFKAGYFDLFLIMDGATDTPDSGGFARQIRHELQRSVRSLSTDRFNLEQVNQQFIQALNGAQQHLQRKCIGDVASLLLVIHHNNQLIANSWGDCLLGTVTAGTTIQWLTQPHTYANAVEKKSIKKIASDSQRHHLTRSFKARRYTDPDTYHVNLLDGEKAILASDGFWACMSEAEQQRLLSDPYAIINPQEDDVSIITFKP